MARVGIEITSRCNMACAMCGHAVMTRPRLDMPFDLFCRVVDDIRDHGHTLHQLHFMGELLMDAGFERKLEYLASRGVTVETSFSTNCLLLTDERIRSLIDAGFCQVHKSTRMVRLSIDSMDKAVYDSLRPGGNHDLVIENAKRFIEATKGQLSGLCVQRLITDRNEHETETAFKQFGVPIRSQKVGLHHDTSRDLRCVKDKKDRRGECTQLSNDLIWVMADGRVTGCCLDSDCLQPFGNMNTQAISDMQTLRNRQIEQFSQANYSELDQCNACYGDNCPGRW